VGATFDVIKLEFDATETHNTAAKLERASFRGYSLKKEDTTPALRKEFTAKNALYASQREEGQRAHEAPIVAVSGDHYKYGLPANYRRFRLSLGQRRQKGTEQTPTKGLIGWRRRW
jgi:hypothetical protein